MKKIICSFLCLFICVTLSCEAKPYKFPKEQRKQYKIEIEQKLDIEKEKAKQEADKIYNQAFNLYQVFNRDKNHMKRNYEYFKKIESLTNEFNTIEFNIYLSLIDITEKYTPVKNQLPATGYAGELGYFIHPYFDKNKVNYDKLDEIISYNASTLRKIDSFRWEIYKYSHEYETKKINNFYEKNIAPKIKEEPGDLAILFQAKVPLKTNEYYWCRPQIVQIFEDGFLANVAPAATYFESVIFVQDPDSNKLLPDDCFSPYLPLKFTGRYFQYRTILGEHKTVPIFNVFIPANEKKQALPQIKETFYFAQKPIYKDIQQSMFWYINHITVFHNMRVIYYTGEPSFIWK